jgi:two-component system response regulator (stage 0 sporulation protein F)
MPVNQSRWGSEERQGTSDPDAHATILVVDDEEHILKLYQKELSEEGYVVRTATDGEEALKMAQGESPDLVILDIKLQDKDGLEVLGGLRRISQKIPIILNSAYSTYKSDFQSWLADAYLVKSPNLDKLKEKIRALLDLKRSG